MYDQLKSIIKKAIPSKLLFRLEGPLRRGLYLFYKGDNFQCNVCHKNLRAFVSSDHQHKVCPYCGSIERNRRLWDLLNQGYLESDPKILHFSPSRSLYRKFKKLHGSNYLSSDMSSDFISDTSMDITALDSKASEFDIIICYHILEHVLDDRKAMDELYRVLDENGTCFIQTPFKEGKIYEDGSIISEADRLAHFGQEDHVRIYSISGLQERLEKSGFQVQVASFNENSENEYGFSSKESIMICKKKSKSRNSIEEYF